MRKPSIILSRKKAERLINRLSENWVTPTQRKLAVRNVTMALLMRESKLRLSEVVRLTIHDLSVQGMLAGRLRIVRGFEKRSHERFVPLSETVCRYIELMGRFWWTPDGAKAGNFAFYNRSSMRPISQRQFQRIVKEAALEALGYPIKPNDFRQV